MGKVYCTVFETGFGWVAIVGRDGKLIGVELPKPTRKAAMAGIPPAAEEAREGFGRLPEQMMRYFAGERVCFECEVEVEGVGDFERQVLVETMKVSYGSVTTYGALAAAVGSPRAARAVGNAMKRNPLPIVIPCHRVIHSGGGLGGFGGGPDMKRHLLALGGVEL